MEQLDIYIRRVNVDTHFIKINKNEPQIDYRFKYKIKTIEL